jgi:membrane fusion protein, multidrug efflux system
VHAADTTGLVVINQIDPIAVIFTLPEDALPGVAKAMRENPRVPLQAHALAREDGKLLATGHLVLVNNQIDTATGTFQLKALFANTDHALWPGQYVNVRLLLGMQDDALTVPDSVVQRSPDGLFAYVVGDDGVAKSQPIKVARTQEGTSIIAEGLATGARVVVDGQYKIRQGSKVVEAGTTDAAGKSSATSASKAAKG